MTTTTDLLRECRSLLSAGEHDGSELGCDVCSLIRRLDMYILRNHDLAMQLEGALGNSEGKDFEINAAFVRELIDALDPSLRPRA